MDERSADRAWFGSRSVRLRAEVRRPGANGTEARELRILGDTERGFILAGGADLLADEEQEFWFAEVDDAVLAAAALGADACAWREIALPKDEGSDENDARFDM